jgi:predicted lipoprotein
VEAHGDQSPEEPSERRHTRSSIPRTGRRIRADTSARQVDHYFPQGCAPMSAAAATDRSARPRWRGAATTAAVVALIAAMAWSTKIVKIGSDADVQPNVFSPEAFGAAEFPKIQAAVEARAVSAVTLAAEIAKDKAAAAKAYGVEASIGPEISVKFTGVVGTGQSGVYFVQVEGVPENLRIRVQTGPAINGTDLRDATGTISFGQFVNQIEYQNAGSAINKEMKKQILAKIDNSALTGKTVSVVGVFKLVNPNAWLVTPVRLDVQ